MSLGSYFINPKNPDISFPCKSFWGLNAFNKVSIKIRLQDQPDQNTLQRFPHSVTGDRPDVSLSKILRRHTQELWRCEFGHLKVWGCLILTPGISGFSKNLKSSCHEKILNEFSLAWICDSSMLGKVPKLCSQMVVKNGDLPW